MAKIERRIKKAFINAVPDVLDSVLEKCTEEKGQVTDVLHTNDMTNITMTKRRRPILRIAAIAAALVSILTVTVTAAVSLSGLQDVNEAELAALNHAVMSCEDVDQKGELTALLLSGVDYNTKAELGLSGLRTVYNIQAVIGGYTVDAKVDAKTLVVLDSKIEYSEKVIERGNEAVLKDSNGKPSPKYPEPVPEFVPVPANIQPAYILRDRYGLLSSEIIDQHGTLPYCYYADNGKDIVTELDIDGYRYEITLDGETFEEISSSVTELKDYTGEKVLHEKVDGYVSMIDAVKIAGEEMGVDLWKLAADLSDDNPLQSMVVCHRENNRWMVKDFEGMIAEVDVRYDNHRYTYYLDAVSGEVLDMNKRLDMDYVLNKCAEHFGVEWSDLMAAHVSYGEKPGVCTARFTLKTDGVYYNVTFDNETCEIVSIEKGKQEKAEDLGFRNIYTLSTETPEGMISEAEAAATALEFFGHNITQARDDFRLTLEDDVYHIGWTQQTFSSGKLPAINYTCDVDAKTGAIVNSTPKLNHADISNTSGFIGKGRATELAKQRDESGDAVIEKITRVELGEMCVSATDSEIVYTAVYQVHFDYKGREGETWFYPVDAVTGEVYTKLGNGLYK